MERGPAAVVIGAGIVGLACAQKLLQRLGSVLVIDPEAGPGRQTSSRNSGVIHAGIYYPGNSLKTRLCIEGNRLLYAWCEAQAVPYERSGKLVIASTLAELAKLEALAKHAQQVGAGQLQLLDATELSQREPAVRGLGALWSPRSGIVDAHALIASLARRLREDGGDLAFRARAKAIRRAGRSWIVQTEDSLGRQAELRTARVVNAAGLGAIEVARRSGLDERQFPWRLHPCKGSYFALGPGAPSTRCRLIYPMPEQAGLGIHLTTDLSGSRRLGPDAEYVEELDYDVDEAKAEHFAAAAARYLPEVTAADLSPDYAGIRPKLLGPGEGFSDFVIASPPSQPGMTHLIGIESPGLTAALAIGRFVASLPV